MDMLFYNSPARFGPQHLLTPTRRAKVICLLSGAVVEITIRIANPLAEGLEPRRWSSGVGTGGLSDGQVTKLCHIGVWLGGLGADHK